MGNHHQPESEGRGHLREAGEEGSAQSGHHTLTFAVHLDDYHNNESVVVEDREHARSVLLDNQAGQYDVDRVHYDGKAWPDWNKPTYEDMVTLMNPHWQKCGYCGGFHPTSSEC